MHLCMRTTVDVDDTLLARAKERAAAEGTTLTSIIEQALAALLAPRPTQSTYSLKWKTHKGHVMPGVDVANRDALFDIMDGKT